MLVTTNMDLDDVKKPFLTPWTLLEGMRKGLKRSCL
jgi:hypothetical protein